MSLSASQTGKAVEHLLAAYCILTSDGQRNVSLPLVDEEGIDLILNLNGKRKRLLLQVKSRANLTVNDTYRTQVREQTLHPRDDVYLLFVNIDCDTASFTNKMWLIPSKDLNRHSALPDSTSSRRVFQSRFDSPSDKWARYRIEPKELATELMDILGQL
jgi:hypothetical protein